VQAVLSESDIKPIRETFYSIKNDFTGSITAEKFVDKFGEETYGRVSSKLGDSVPFSAFCAAAVSKLFTQELTHSVNILDQSLAEDSKQE